MEINSLVQVALATDTEVNHALTVLVKRLTISHANLGKLVQDPEELRTLLRQDLPAALAAEQQAQGQQVRAMRTILVELASDPATAGQVGAAFKERDKMLEPVTTALVLAGIVVVLSTKIEVEAVNENGKTRWRLKIVKSGAPDALLKKFFSLFGA